MNARGWRPEPHRQERWKRGVSRGITRQRDHAAYSRCMHSLVDEMCCIPLTFYREKMLIRHVLTAGAVGCENPLSSRISSHSECFPLFIYFCTLIWGLCEMLHFIRKWEKRERKGVLKRPRRGMRRGHGGHAVDFCSSAYLRWATRLSNTHITRNRSVLPDFSVYYTAVSSSAFENIKWRLLKLLCFKRVLKDFERSIIDCNIYLSWGIFSELCAAAKWKNSRKLNHNTLWNWNTYDTNPLDMCFTLLSSPH